MAFVSQFQRGDVVADKYRILRVLGQGGMGMVYEANHLGLDRRVALKVMVRNADTNDDAVVRFQREARATARLNSPHVAKVLDVGCLEQGSPYLVMELLEGSDLRALLQQRGKIPIAEAVDYLLEACEALAEAHCNGIVHRDLKPANLFLANDAYGGQVIKLLDFGVSKMLFGNARSDPQLTDTHSMMGSPAYMSPEQMRSARDVDHRADIWSLGAVLFEMVTGRTPWSCDSLGELLAQIANEPAPSVRQRLPAAPPELDTVISRCLEKPRGSRYQSVADLALALHPLGSKRARTTLDRVLRISGQSTEPGVVTQVNSPDTTAGAMPAGVRRPARRARRLVVASVFGGLLLATVGLWLMQRNKGHGAEPAHQILGLSSVVVTFGASSSAGPSPHVPQPTPGIDLQAAASLSAAAPLPPMVAAISRPSAAHSGTIGAKRPSNGPRAVQQFVSPVPTTGEQPAVAAPAPPADPMSIRR